MDYLKQKEYWIECSTDDIQAARRIFESKNYDWTLFVGHLALEKVLKAYYVHNKKSIPPKTHKLDYLAELSELKISDENISFLTLVNEFNIETRYPDYKRKFKEICTQEFASEYLIKIEVMHKWILEQIK